MALDNATFPSLELKHALVKSPSYPVSVVTNGTIEYRTARVRWEKFSWTIPAHVIRDQGTAKRQEIYKFLSDRRWSLNAFKYVDPQMPTLTDNVLTHRSGTTWYLMVNPSASTSSLMHPIFQPDAGMVIKKNGTSAAYTFSISADGYPIVTVASASSGDTITASGAFYYPVRLANTVSWSTAALNTDETPALVTISDIVLTEVFPPY